MLSADCGGATADFAAFFDGAARSGWVGAAFLAGAGFGAGLVGAAVATGAAFFAAADGRCLVGSLRRAASGRAAALARTPDAAGEAAGLADAGLDAPDLAGAGFADAGLRAAGFAVAPDPAFDFMASPLALTLAREIPSHTARR